MSENDGKLISTLQLHIYADVAELVDALASGASASNGVKVRAASGGSQGNLTNELRSFA